MYLLNKKLRHTTNIYLTEQFRNYQLLIMNCIIPVLFFTCSLIFKMKSLAPQSEIDMVISSQFFSVALMFGLFSYSFTSPLSSICDINENQTIPWIKQTGLKPAILFLGNKLANLIILNLHTIITCILFFTLITPQISLIFCVFILVNLSFFIINSFSFIFSKIIKNKNFANNFSNLTLLLLMFSLTFSSLLSSVLGIKLSIVNSFLTLNPLFGYYNTFNSLLGNTDYFFGNLFGNILYMIIYMIIIYTIEYQLNKNRF